MLDSQELHRGDPYLAYCLLLSVSRQLMRFLDLLSEKALLVARVRPATPGTPGSVTAILPHHEDEPDGPRSRLFRRAQGRHLDN